MFSCKYMQKDRGSHRVNCRARYSLAGYTNPFLLGDVLTVGALGRGVAHLLKKRPKEAKFAPHPTPPTAPGTPYLP